MVFRHTNTYDEQGNILSEENDRDGDGVVDSRSTHTYDEHGNLLSWVEDEGGDGVIDWRRVWEGDARADTPEMTEAIP